MVNVIGMQGPDKQALLLILAGGRHCDLHGCETFL